MFCHICGKETEVIHQSKAIVDMVIHKCPEHGVFIIKPFEPGQGSYYTAEEVGSSIMAKLAVMAHDLANKENREE